MLNEAIASVRKPPGFLTHAILAPRQGVGQLHVRQFRGWEGTEPANSLRLVLTGGSWQET
jgi:hypothetical protein